jgi:hypothetical protein
MFANGQGFPHARPVLCCWSFSESKCTAWPALKCEAGSEKKEAGPGRVINAQRPPPEGAPEKKMTKVTYICRSPKKKCSTLFCFCFYFCFYFSSVFFNHIFGRFVFRDKWTSKTQ